VPSSSSIPPSILAREELVARWKKEKYKRGDFLLNFLGGADSIR
jgi:hypothetical protein